MKDIALRKVAIIGVGLMGGSFARAFKERFPSAVVAGYARNEHSQRRLESLGILDLVSRDLAAVLVEADLVVLSMPVSLIVEYLGRIGSLIKPGALVIDLGSTKSTIERAASKLPGSVCFAGCHPLCGSEKSGAAAGRKDLYQGAVCLITAPQKSRSAQRAARLWRALGSRVMFIGAREHDRLLAAVSHLPHVISFALTQFIPEAYLAQSAPSLKDLTRIAGSPANIWADIFLSNRKNIVRNLGGFIKILEDFRAAIEAGDDVKLTRLITSVNKKHKRFL